MNENNTYSLVTWRRNYIERLVGRLYGYKEGIITIEFPNGIIKTLKTKNVAKRLDQILKQLMGADNQTYTDKWVEELREKRKAFSKEEIEELKIIVTKENFPFWKKQFEDLPKGAGVYCLKFPNNKIFLGQSVNIKKKVLEILTKLDNSAATPQWIGKCLKENLDLDLAAIEVSYELSGSRKELLKEKLEKCNKEGCYN